MPYNLLIPYLDQENAYCAGGNNGSGHLCYIKHKDINPDTKILSFGLSEFFNNLNNIDDVSDIINLYHINRSDIYNNDRSFIRKLNHVHKKIDAYKNSFSSVQADISNVRIETCIPDKILHEFIDCRLQFLQMFGEYIKDKDLSYYNSYFKLHKYGVFNLDSLAVDIQKFCFASISNQSVRNAAKNVKLLKNTNILSPFKINLFGTRTGRISIDSGLNILILPKNYRHIIKSKFKDGKVFLLDFAAMEARVTACLLGNNNIANLPDIYDHFAQLFFNHIDNKRELFKKLFFAILFGASIDRCVEVTGLSLTKTKEIIKKLSVDFPWTDIQKLFQIEQDKNEQKYIKNYYGRPIFIDKAQAYQLINYFIQSTAADMALQILYKVIKYKQENHLQSGPIYIHHDAIAFDFAPDEIDKHLPKITSIMTNNNNWGVSFPVKTIII